MSVVVPDAEPAVLRGLTGDVHLVLGPKTRLGRAILARDGTSAIAVARSGADAGTLQGDDARVLTIGTPVPDLSGATSVRIDVCALGPVHPDAPDAAADARGATRDLDFVRALLAEVPAGTPVRVVFISTVIALAPGPDRRYYGGWKCLVEEQLHAIVESHQGAELAVLYPGRLVAPGEGGATRFLNTSYERLASAVDDSASGGRRDRVVGFDARLWLLVRGLKILVSVLAGSGGYPKGGRTTVSHPSEEKQS